MGKGVAEFRVRPEQAGRGVQVPDLPLLDLVADQAVGGAGRDRFAKAFHRLVQLPACLGREESFQ
jgi:hypothetical protein